MAWDLIRISLVSNFINWKLKTALQNTLVNYVKKQYVTFYAPFQIHQVIMKCTGFTNQEIIDVNLQDRIEVSIKVFNLSLQQLYHQT